VECSTPVRLDLVFLRCLCRAPARFAAQVRPTQENEAMRLPSEETTDRRGARWQLRQPPRFAAVGIDQ